MEPRNQFVTLEQAKKLRELGCSQASLFYYDTVVKWEGEDHSIFYDGFDISENETSHHFSAYTASELGEMLPSQSGVISWDVFYNDHLGCWNCRIYDLVKWQKQDQYEHNPPIAYESEGDTMAECMADALIHCLENKLVNPS